MNEEAIVAGGEKSPTPLQRAITHVRMQPDDADGWTELGRLLRGAERFQEARESFERAIYLAPEREELYQELMALDAGLDAPEWLAEIEGELARTGGTLRRRSARPRWAVPLLAPLLAILLAVGGFAIGRTLVRDPGPSSLTAIELVDPATGELAPGGQTRALAVPPGQALVLRDGAQLRVLEVVDDPPVSQIRFYYDADGDGEKEWFDGQPPEGMVPYIVQVEVANTGREDAYLGESYFGLLTGALHSFEEGCGIAPGEMDGLLDPGEINEGGICILVPEGERAEVEYLYYDWVGERRFFVLPTDG